MDNKNRFEVSHKVHMTADNSSHVIERVKWFDVMHHDYIGGAKR